MKPMVGLAWYEADEWEELRAVAPDADKLEPTYAERRAFADKTLRDLRAEGYDARPVPVKIAELRAWCAGLGRRPDGSTRAEYAAAELQRLHGPSSLDGGA